VQDAFEVRIVHADLLHMVERIPDVVHARAPLADALGDQARAPVQVELADIRGMRRIGEEGEGAHVPAGTQGGSHQPRCIDAARHFPVPQVPKRAPHVGVRNPERHSPARAALAKAHDEARPAPRAPVARGQDAQGAVVPVYPREGLFPERKARRPDE
jgi:hypothetical protein